MIDSLKARFAELVESVVTPVWDWILSRSWLSRALILALILAGMLAWYRPDIRSAAYDRVVVAARGIIAGDERLPLPRAASELNRTTINRLAEAVDLDLANLEHLTPWSASQAVFALRSAGREVAIGQRFVEFTRSQARPGCFCWTELPGDPPDEIHTAISGWVMAAFANVGTGPSAEELRSVLDMQNRSGWWPTFPKVLGEEGASTYATAWIVLGLLELQEKGLIPEQEEAAARQAMARATSWLMMTRDPEDGWKDYPYYRRGVASHAISAFVIHVLHEAGREDLQEIDRSWLGALPPPDATGVPELEKRYQELRTEQGIRIDHLTQVPIAWLVVGTTDAYANGSPQERAEALRWLQELTGQERIVTAHVNPNNWWRAELLYALHHLQTHLG